MKNKLKIFAIMFSFIIIITLVTGFIPHMQKNVLANSSDYHSPFDCAYSPNGSYIAVSNLTKAQLTIIDANTNSMTRTVQLNGKPKGVAWSGSNLVYVAEYDGGNVAEIDPSSGNILRRFPTGPKPTGVKVSGNNLVVTDFGLKRVTIVNLSTGTILGHVTVDDYPMFLDITPDGTYAVVGHATPTGDATLLGHASAVTFITISSRTIAATIKLPFGSTNVRGVKCSPDGNWVYVAHNFGKQTLPPTQLEKGWTNTNAISILDASQREYYTTFLLDTMSDGAANPWGLAISSNSNTLWVSVSGIHQVYKVDVAFLHELIAGNIPGTSPSTSGGPFSSSAIYKFVNRTSGKCIDVPGGNTANGVQLVQWTDNGGVNQQWRISSNSEGYYFITSVVSNKNIDNYGSTNNNAPINQYDQGGSNNQQWRIVDIGNGYYKMLCRTGGLAMDNGGSTADDAGIVQNPDNGANSQQWKIVMVGGSSSNAGVDMTYRSKANYNKPYSDIWFKIKNDPAQLKMLKYDLSALWGAGILTKIKLPGQGPRGITISPNGSRVATGAYFAGNVYVISTSGNNITNTISLGSQPAEDSVRRGERIFHDGSTTMQGWLSCTTCHPGVRSDGFNWDEANDGLGNYKNTKTLLNTYEYTPKTWRGIRPDAATSVNAGFLHAKFVVPTQQNLDDTRNFIRSLSAEISPYRNADGTLTADALAGKALFESSSARCSSCHSGAYFTSMEKHNVGTVDSQDRSQGFTDGYIVPTLIELWRTAPYLHDGSAPTLLDVISTKNPADQHGKTSNLSTQQKNQLVAYLLQIPTTGNEEPPGMKGDVNSNGTVDIVDALLTAQHYVDLNPPGFVATNADVNCSGTIDIVDALLMAQYYVELITSFDC
ncbi:MAG: RICIN domain-containing protein [Spirochaetales bacterium]|nr:RICIN domain-containing protein [Spirochaetales bacterium]